jgi:prevent-host-death family protein
MINVVNASDARLQFQDIIDRVYFGNTRVIVTKNGKPRIFIQQIPENDPEVLAGLEEYTKKIAEIKMNKSKKS